jgi:O-antigen/teichoic acid export membrane protein
MLLSIPVALISISVSSVLLERISNKFKERVSLVKELSRIGLILIFLGLFEILIIKIFGEDLFRIFFGSQWGYSGVLAKILVWSYTLNFIISSFNSLFLSLNRIKLLSLWQLIYFIAILSLILFRNFPFENFVKIYVLVELCSFILLAFFLFTIVSDYERKICQH